MQPPCTPCTAWPGLWLSLRWEGCNRSCLIRVSDLDSNLGSGLQRSLVCSPVVLGDLVAIWRRICSTHNCCGNSSHLFPGSFLPLAALLHLKWDRHGLARARERERETAVRSGRPGCCQAASSLWLPAPCLENDLFEHARSTGYARAASSSSALLLLLCCCCCRLVVWQRRLIAKQLIRVIGHLTPTCSNSGVWDRAGILHKLGIRQSSCLSMWLFFGNWILKFNLIADICFQFWSLEFYDQ